MVTIVGNPLGAYNFERLNVDFSKYEMIICDKNFIDEMDNLYKLSFQEAKEFILKNAFNKEILYIVTGSVLFFSAATLIVKFLRSKNITYTIIDTISSKDYFLQKLAISQHEVSYFSLHGKSDLDLSELFRKKYTFILCDENTINILREAFRFLKKELYKVYLGKKFGYLDEEIKVVNLYLSEFDNAKDLMPYSLLIEKFYEETFISNDSDFAQDDGMITKKYKRHLALQNLDLCPNMFLWDIGSGSGSVSIDAYKRYKVKTALFEKNPKRADDIKINLINHNVIDSRLYIGKAQDFFMQVDDPDRIFIGGGGDEIISSFLYLFDRLKTGGVMLINYVVLEYLSKAVIFLKENKINFEIYSISITNYKHSFLMSESERLLHQIKIIK